MLNKAWDAAGLGFAVLYLFFLWLWYRRWVFPTLAMAQPRRWFGWALYLFVKTLCLAAALVLLLLYWTIVGYLVRDEPQFSELFYLGTVASILGAICIAFYPGAFLARFKVTIQKGAV